MGVNPAILLHRFTYLIMMMMMTFFFQVHWKKVQGQSIQCPEINNKRAEREFDNAVKAFRLYELGRSIRSLNNVIDIEPEYADAYFLLGLIYIEETRMNLKEARKNFQEVIRLCPNYDPYAYFHLARIAYGAKEYSNALKYIRKFLEDVDKIRTDEDYNEAIAIEDYAAFYTRVLNNPVPFDPKPVPGISTPEDEYLPIISPDNELALFTRRMKIPPRRDDLTPQVKYKERFMKSRRIKDHFEEGVTMPHPFNLHDNEGGATLTIDNKELFYTLCRYSEGSTYYNCDICYSKKHMNGWSDIVSIGNNVNREDTWESQPTVTSDGRTLYFVSDRPGGYGGYDIYRTDRDSNGTWGPPENLGKLINSAGNEKSPFIHTDSQTLYFSSDGLVGLGGYDIFFSKLDTLGRWSTPKNIGYPINSYDDDVGFFVSTDGHYGYFASNKFDGFGGWDLYSFDLYKEARPERVLFVKGDIRNEEKVDFKNARVELTNVRSKKVTQIPVDTVTGKYVAAVLFRDDFVLTIKHKGYVNESKYLAKIDPRTVTPFHYPVELEPIEVGKSYRLNDVFFEFNSFDLLPESRAVITEFYNFLRDNPSLKVSIEGHTDEIGNDQDNLTLSLRRARAVYDHLIVLGIDPDRISYKGFGESRPVSENLTEEGRAMNRRTEFVIISK